MDSMISAISLVERDSLMVAKRSASSFTIASSRPMSEGVREGGWGWGCCVVLLLYDKVSG